MIGSPDPGAKSSNKWTTTQMMTNCDNRLEFNGQPILTEHNDQHETTWEHNIIAARWSPNTGWTYP